MNHDLALFQSIADALLEEEEKEPVLSPEAPEELFKRLQIDLKEHGISDEEFAPILKDLVLSTPRTATRRFFNQLFGGRNSKATLGELLSVLLNNSMYTYKVGGPMVGLEKEIIKKSAALLGYPKTSDGTFAPGGSMTNFMGMLMARDFAQSTIRKHGVEGAKLCLYTSKESHYSIPKNAAFMGVGRDQIRYIPSDDRGAMRMDALQENIEADRQAGHRPFLIIGTAGTTVMGAFDPMNEIADICQKEGIWFHVDGAYCGSVMFSDQYRHLIQGAERADSFSYNAHKMLGTPLSCSLILVKDKKWLYESFSNDADYLYQTDGDDYNLGKTSLQCGRRNDALKFWSLWKSIGTKGLAEIVNKQFDLADYALKYVQSHPDYTVYSHENSLGICFNYKDIPADLLCNQLYESGELMVGYGQFKGEQFVRLVTVNAGNETTDIDNFFKQMEAFAERILNTV